MSSLSTILILSLVAMATSYPTVASREHVDRVWQRRDLPIVDDIDASSSSSSSSSSLRMNEPLRIALTHSVKGKALLVSRADEVADPQSKSYGEYLSKAEIGELLMNNEESERVVRDWLRDAELIDEQTRVDSVITRDWLVVHNVRLDRLAAALGGVQFHAYEHRGSGRTLRRTLDQPKLPAHVAPHVELMLGVGDFFDHKRERRAAAQLVANKARAATADATTTAAPKAVATNTPDISSLRGSHQRMAVSLRVYNLAGQPMTALEPKSYINGNITDRSGQQFFFLSAIDAPDCTIDASNTVVCSYYLTSSIPYARVTVTAQAVYSTPQGYVYGDIGVMGYNATLAPWIDPATAADIYRIPQNTFATSGRATQAVVAFEEQYISMDDLKKYYHLHGLPFNASLFHIIGPNHPSSPGGESTLDITWISTMGRNIPSYFLSFCGPAGPAKGPCGAYVLDWALMVSNWTSSPQVTSISYGDTEQAFFAKFGSFSYIDRMEIELAKMALNGLTVIAGSGDAGASNVGEDGNDVGPTDVSCGVVRPFYPSDSKYVVSASASVLATSTTGFCNAEAATNNIQCSRVAETSVSMTYGGTPWTTGGAFSSHIPAPSWQAAAVAQYFASVDKSELPPSGWNPKGRAYADLSAIGFNLVMVQGGRIVPVGGTSASGPVLGGIFALLNDLQLSKNRPTLGNPLPWIWTVLAKTPGAFNDLTYGRNDDGDLQPRGSPFPSRCPFTPGSATGFPLAPLWDSPSGWGSPVWPVWVDNLP
jgi:subtilase family serine protease